SNRPRFILREKGRNSTPNTRISVDRETTIIRYRITPILIYKGVEEEDNPKKEANLENSSETYIDLDTGAEYNIVSKEFAYRNKTTSYTFFISIDKGYYPRSTLYL
ncbi:hypothetical protein N7530_005989, partial [Penicillium desertorum]